MVQLFIRGRECDASKFSKSLLKKKRKRERKRRRRRRRRKKYTFIMQRFLKIILKTFLF
jgi:hypothetical protein